MVKLRILVALSASALAIACVPQPEAAPPPPPPPTPAPSPAPAPPPAADWRDIPLTPGTWTYASGAAAFGPAGGAPLFRMRCDRTARQVILIRAGTAAPGGLTLRTSSSQRTLPVAAETDAPLATRLAANDRFLDDIAFSRGRFTVVADGLPTLVIPAWAEPARVIEDCRI